MPKSFKFENFEGDVFLANNWESSEKLDIKFLKDCILFNIILKCLCFNLSNTKTVIEKCRKKNKKTKKKKNKKTKKKNKKRFRKLKGLIIEFIIQHSRSSHPEVFLEKGVLKICSKFTGEHPCRSAISIKLESNWKALDGCF